ncbi:MAG: hypothetical protein ACREIC_21365, partial [Limisphaerales bacterium]
VYPSSIALSAIFTVYMLHAIGKIVNVRSKVFMSRSTTRQEGKDFRRRNGAWELGQTAREL